MYKLLWDKGTRAGLYYAQLCDHEGYIKIEKLPGSAAFTVTCNGKTIGTAATLAAAKTLAQTFVNEQ